MARWIEFGRYNRDGDGFQPICGSDGTLPIDGRWGLVRMFDFADQHIRNMQRLGKDFVTFRTLTGESLLTAQASAWHDA